MAEGDVYRGHYRGEEIDRLLGLIGSALQPGSLTPYLTKAAANELYLLKQTGMGLSSNDFTTALKQKLLNLPTLSELEAALNSICNYRILTFTTDKATTRLTVPSSQRRYALMVSFNMNGEHITEKYISSDISDTEWVKDSNWTNLSIREKPKRPTAEGVYILDIDGYYTPYRQWRIASNAQSVAVAIIDIRASFMIAPTDIGKYQWSAYDNRVPGIISTYDTDELKRDYFGEHNTQLIIKEEGSGAQAAYNCHAYRFRNNKEGHLPGWGEMWVAFQHGIELAEALQMIGNPMTKFATYWTSTQCPAGHAWNFMWCHAEHSCYYKYTNYLVRPFGELPEEL